MGGSPFHFRVEQKLQQAQREMTEALEDFEREETAKFNQIYDLLQELCTKQHSLESSVQALEAETQFLPFMGMAMPGMPGMVPMVMCPQLMPQFMMMNQMSAQMPQSQFYHQKVPSSEAQTESTEAETPTMSSV